MSFDLERFKKSNVESISFGGGTPSYLSNDNLTTIFIALKENFSFNADHILSNWATVYASGDVMIMAEDSQSSWWFWGEEESNYQEMTNLHVFDISNPGQTDYIASGRINGTIQDQFSLSEHNGNIRVCSTTGQWGRWWMDNPEPMVSHVFVLSLNSNFILIIDFIVWVLSILHNIILD